MTIEFDGIKLEGEAADALTALRENEAFTQYVADAVKNREEAASRSVRAEYEPFKNKADEYKGKLDEFRQNNLTLKEQLEAVKGIDPEEYKKLKALGSGANKAAEQLERVELEYRGQLEERDKQINTGKTAMEELTAKWEASEKGRADDSFRFDAIAAINKYNAENEALAVRPKAVNDLVTKMMSSHKTIDGQRVMMYNGREFTTDAGIGQMDEWIAKVARSEYDYMFDKPTGGGASGSGGSKAGPKSISRSDFNSKSATEQRDLIMKGVIPVD